MAVDEGLPNEDRGLIVGFGSILLQQPNSHPHTTGAIVVRIALGAPPTAPNDLRDDDRDKPKKETEDERRQHARTNQGNKDDESTEGDVIETHCDQPWPSVVIANRDGLVEIRLLKEAQRACSSIRVGDYLEVAGQKQHEALFDADSVEIRRNGERVR